MKQLVTEPIDYSECEKELISAPRFIQSYGALLIMGEGIVMTCSKNINEFLSVNCETLINKRLESVAPAFSERIKTEFSAIEEGQPLFFTESPLLIKVHKNEDDFVFIELFRNSFHSLGIEALAKEIDTLRNQYDYPAKDRQEFLTEVCQIFQKHLKFDQVFVQIFHENAFIEVAAEANNGAIETIQGLHYSAKEIPSQARNLYLKQLVRFKQNSQETPTELFCNGDGCVDLSTSLLREVSPYLTVYLQNMSVSSMLSFSIVTQNDLAGLLTCHNKEPLFLDPREYLTLVNIVKLVSLELRRIDHLLKKNAESNLLGLLIKGFPPDRVPALIQLVKSPDLERFLIHCGKAVMQDGKLIATSGECPNSTIQENIFKNSLKSNFSVTFSSNLAEDLNVSKNDLGDIAGALTIRFENICLILFRKQFPSEIRWRRAKANIFDKDTGLPRFSPVGSLLFFTEEFQDRSRPWSEKDLAFANVISDWIFNDFEN